MKGAYQMVSGWQQTVLFVGFKCVNIYKVAFTLRYRNCLFLVLQCQGDCYTISEAQRFFCELLSPHLAFASCSYLFVVSNCMLWFSLLPELYEVQNVAFNPWTSSGIGLSLFMFYM